MDIAGYVWNFGMKNNKAPGPDGFTATFYKQNGDVVGAAVLAAVSFLFNTGVGFNSITLTLIPNLNPLCLLLLKYKESIK